MTLEDYGWIYRPTNRDRELLHGCGLLCRRLTPGTPASLAAKKNLKLESLVSLMVPDLDPRARTA